MILEYAHGGALDLRLEMNRSVGLMVIVGGACVVIIGLLIYAGALSWFGRLPGDIRYEGEHIWKTWPQFRRRWCFMKRHTESPLP